MAASTKTKAKTKSAPAALTRLSPYENRLKLVRETTTAHSTLDDDAAGVLAVHLLDALDSIPERIR